jgi:hypothetical protein
LPIKWGFGEAQEDLRGRNYRLVKKVVRSDKMRQNFIGKSQVRS